MGKLLLQSISEDVLKRHGIDPSADAYCLKLSLPNYELIMGRVGEQILIGNPYLQLGFDYNEGQWLPVQIEQASGKTICSFIENGKRMIILYRMKRFMLFQGMLAKNIRGLFENGVKVE